MNLLDTPRGRKILFTALYLGEGIPIGFLWWTLPTLMRREGVDVERIGWFSSVLVLPWALKFVWAPLIDGARGTRLGLKGCIVIAQSLMAATLLPLAFTDLRTGFSILVPCLLAHATSAATQDAAIDALAISSTSEDERGSLNGWMQAGMLAGRGALGGGALILTARWGMHAVVVFIAAILAAMLLLSLTYREDARGSGRREAGRIRRIAGLMRAAASRGTTWFALLFAALAGAGFEATGILAGPFLVDRGFDASAVGWFYSLPSVLAMMAGAIAGGAAADRFGRLRCVAISQVLLGGAILTLALLAVSGERAAGAEYWIALTAIYFGIGLFTASSYALFMDLTDPGLGATQFSAYMGATNFCESWAAGLGGRLASGFGYTTAFTVMTAVSLLALPLLLFLRSPRGGWKAGEI